MTRDELEALLHASFHRRTGSALALAAGDAALYAAPGVVLMHGRQADPLFCYANRAAQALWGFSWDEFTALPSRLSAEPVAREERQRLLERARERGFIDDYAGVRIARDGRRFRITGVVLWNVDDAAGVPLGQAAVFRAWTFL